MKTQKTYFVIDLKSFYASVECVERGLDPMTARLVVADPARTEKTICLAVSVGMKALGVPNRCRVYQIPKTIDYIMAPPRMQLYLDYSLRVYDIYLKYFSEEDIHVYSVDEAFMDMTPYRQIYSMTARELAGRILGDIRDTLGLYATCGIGSNLYLAKIALDILAKHAPDFIGELDEQSYRKKLWTHRPLTDFWMVGKGTAKRLAGIGICCMQDIAMADEKLLFRLFGINAELLMDHAWGLESVTMADIKNYQTKSNSVSSGQVLPRDYNYTECRLVVKEMCELLCLRLIRERKLTAHVHLLVCSSKAPVVWGLHASRTLPDPTNSVRVLRETILQIYDQVALENLYYRRINISFMDLRKEEFEQLDFFMNAKFAGKDRALQQTALRITERYGKNALLKGMNLEQAATTRERNQQIGGHRQ